VRRANRAPRRGSNASGGKSLIRGGRLGGQRQAVEGRADGRDRRECRAGGGEPRRHGPCPRDEELHGLAPRWVGWPTGAVRGQRQRWHTDLMLTIEAQRDAAGRQDAQALQIIDHQEQVAGALRRAELGLVRGGAVLGQAQRLREPEREEGGVAQGRQIDEGHAVGELGAARSLMRHLQAETRLAGPADAGEGHQAGGGQRGVDGGALLHPADQGRGRLWQGERRQAGPRPRRTRHSGSSRRGRREDGGGRGGRAGRRSARPHRG